LRQIQLFDEWNNVHTTFFEYGSPGKVYPDHSELLDFFFHGGRQSGQETGLDPVRDIPKAQIETSGLYLRFVYCWRSIYTAARNQTSDGLRRKNSRCTQLRFFAA
jgi:hypothetical protein